MATELEKALFSEMLGNVEYIQRLAVDYLKGNPNRILELYGPDEDFRFGRPVWGLDVKLSDKDILSIGNLIRNLVLHSQSSMLRLLEGDISAGKFYADDEIVNYTKRHIDYSGGPFCLVDLRGSSISDNNLYDNFVGYVMDKENGETDSVMN